MPKLMIWLCLLIIVFSSVRLAYAGNGSAETRRTKNLQYFEMTPSIHPPRNASMTRTRNLQLLEMTLPVHPSGSAEVARTRNLQFLEMTPAEHPPGDAYTSRIRNLQCLEMSPSIHPPGDARLTRYRNLQYFEMIPTEPLSTTITSLTTTDQNGNQVSAFMPGSMVMFKVVLYGSGSQDITGALVSTMVQDPSLTPIFLSYTYEDIRVGKQTTVYMGFQIPYECILGDYAAKVNLFTLLPSQGGESIIGGHSEVHFTVS